MPITVDWAGTSAIPYQIIVPKDFMTQVQPPPQEIRELDLDAFRMALKDLEDDPDGRPWPRTHQHDAQTTLAGVVYARKIQILPPYTVTFEDGQYAVNFTGANTNVQERANVNQVSIRSNNSAGLVVVSEGGGSAPTVPEIVAGVLGALVPGAYGVGTVGRRIGDSLDASVSGRASSTQATDIQSRLPAALVSGRMDSRVGAMAAGVITATEAPALAHLDVDVSSRAAPGAAMDLAADALDGDAVAASAVAELQAGLATAADVAAVGAAVVAVGLDVDDVQGRLPAALVGGLMASAVGAMAPGVVDATAAPNLDTTVSSRSSAAALALVQADTTELLARLTFARAAALDSIQGIADQVTLVRQFLLNRLELAEGSVNNWVLYKDNGTDVLLTISVTDKDGNPITIDASVPARRSAPVMAP